MLVSKGCRCQQRCIIIKCHDFRLPTRHISHTTERTERKGKSHVTSICSTHHPATTGRRGKRNNGDIFNGSCIPGLRTTIGVTRSLTSTRARVTFNFIIFIRNDGAELNRTDRTSQNGNIACRMRLNIGVSYTHVVISRWDLSAGCIKWMRCPACFIPIIILKTRGRNTDTIINRTGRTYNSVTIVVALAVDGRMHVTGAGWMPFTVAQGNHLRFIAHRSNDIKGRLIVANHTAFGRIGLIHGCIRGGGTIGAGVEVGRSESCCGVIGGR